MTDLLELAARFNAYKDRENTLLWLKTATPWVGDLAYFTIIYKPLSGAISAPTLDRLLAPPALRVLFAKCNGAHLFGGRLSIYGIAEKQLLDRSDPYSLPPFSIERANQLWAGDVDRYLVFAFYRFDGSVACIDRETLEVTIFSPRADRRCVAASSLNEWLTSEFDRFSSFFDHEGHLLTGEGSIRPPD